MAENLWVRIKRQIKSPAKVFGVAMILLVLFFYNVLMLYNGHRLLNSDDSSELLLAKIMSEEHAILTKSYAYGTELNVINTTLVYAPLFHIFSSWSMIRAVAGTIILLIYIATYLWIPYAWKYETKWFYLTAFIIIITFYYTLWFFGLKLYYIPYVQFNFIALALLGHAYNAKSNRERLLLCIFQAVVAFGGGLGGVRVVELAYVPLFLTAFIMWFFAKSDARLVLNTLVAALSSALGFLVNDKIFTRIYDFHSYGGVSYIRLMFEKLEYMLNSVLSCFGYVVGEYFVSFGGACNALAVVLTVLFFATFFILLRKQSDMSVPQGFFYWFSTVVFVLNTIVSILGQNNEYAERYIAIGMVPCIMQMGLLYKLCIKGYDRARIIGTCMIGVFLVLGLRGYMIINHTHVNGDRWGYINYLEENGYDYGYATFWNANITTEMSNGRINVTGLDPNDDNLVVYRWQMDKRQLESEHDKAFLVLAEYELDKYLGHEPIYRDDYFSVFDINSNSISFTDD